MHRVGRGPSRLLLWLRALVGMVAPLLYTDGGSHELAACDLTQPESIATAEGANGPGDGVYSDVTSGVDGCLCSESSSGSARAESSGQSS